MKFEGLPPWPQRRHRPDEGLLERLLVALGFFSPLPDVTCPWPQKEMREVWRERFTHK